MLGVARSVAPSWVMLLIQGSGREHLVMPCCNESGVGRERSGCSDYILLPGKRIKRCHVGVTLEILFVYREEVPW